MTDARAGWMLALAQVVGIASMFFAPVLAGRSPSHHGVVLAAVTLTGAGALGLLVAAEIATVLWVVLLGIGQGA
jgi:MFS transporter, CP family, cyanate transporter